MLAEDVPFIPLLQGSLTIVYSKNVGGGNAEANNATILLHYMQKLSQTTFQHPLLSFNAEQNY
jgi:ABC-type transport system substrate-binding protein